MCACVSMYSHALQEDTVFLPVYCSSSWCSWLAPVQRIAWQEGVNYGLGHCACEGNQSACMYVYMYVCMDTHRYVLLQICARDPGYVCMQCVKWAFNGVCMYACDCVTVSLCKASLTVLYSWQLYAEKMLQYGSWCLDLTLRSKAQIRIREAEGITVAENLIMKNYK